MTLHTSTLILNQSRPLRPPTAPTERKALSLLGRNRLLRAGALESRGIPRAALARLQAAGRIVRIARGVYARAGAPPGTHRDLAVAAARVPAGVVCLLSALRFHGIGTQDPFEVWLALGRGATVPRLPEVPLRILRFAPPLLVEGVQVHVIEGVSVRISTPARTVVDAFKFRGKVGIDVAVEALREGWNDRRFTAEELRTHAVACRMERVMRPYLESIL
ncbi:MAG: type IV toxin-antitoxin system AbiEi family antitoxin domain-containing protein [Planctomycetaceae bacterium]|nr:type IV toxin-antitoxin system AbiEi family antitoxin domain-containing protein [Planctomycetaceae bacterium]